MPARVAVSGICNAWVFCQRRIRRHCLYRTHHDTSPRNIVGTPQRPYVAAGEGRYGRAFRTLFDWNAPAPLGACHLSLAPSLLSAAPTRQNRATATEPREQSKAWARLSQPVVQVKRLAGTPASGHPCGHYRGPARFHPLCPS